jgi:sortase A
LAQNESEVVTVSRRLIRLSGTLMVIAGSLLLVWAVLVWRWQDPFTALYTRWEQRDLAQEYEERLEQFEAQTPVRRVKATVSPTVIAEQARTYRLGLGEGDAIGRLKIPKLDLNMIVVNGTETKTLRKGPARHKRTFLPGEGELIYIAGHRTTYSAPFSDIDDLQPGDRVRLELPYATVEYTVRSHRIVEAHEISVLRSRGREELALQACWPRFFASHRYIAYARPVRVIPRRGRPYQYRGSELRAAPSAQRQVTSPGS